MRAQITGLCAALVVGAAAVGAADATTARAAHNAGRQDRTSGVAIAGADVYVWSRQRSPSSGGGCTLGFSVTSRVTGRPGALTAGHCVGTLPGGPDYAVHRTRDGSGDTTDPGVELGAVGNAAYRFGRHGDSAFVSLQPGRVARPALYVGGPTSHRTIPVAGSARLRRGMDVCYSGAVTGTHCGFRVVGGPQRIGFRDQGRTYRIRHEWRATRGTCTSRAGDSGSPVYVVRHHRAYAVGLLSGGQRSPGRCPFFFTPVHLALSQLHLTLLHR